MLTELFMYVCIKKYVGTQGEVCRQLKIFLPPTVVYATYCVRCCSYSVWLCGLYYGALHVLKSSSAL